MATPKKSSTGKKKCWKQIVTPVPCCKVNNLNNKKKMEKTLLKPALSEGLQERAVREGNSWAEHC